MICQLELKTNHFIIFPPRTKTRNSQFLINTSVKVIPLCGIMISLKLFHTDNISTRQKARAILKKETRAAIARSQVVLYDKDNE